MSLRAASCEPSPGSLVSLGCTHCVEALEKKKRKKDRSSSRGRFQFGRRAAEGGEERARARARAAPGLMTRLHSGALNPRQLISPAALLSPSSTSLPSLPRRIIIQRWGWEAQPSWPAGSCHPGAWYRTTPRQQHRRRRAMVGHQGFRRRLRRLLLRFTAFLYFFFLFYQGRWRRRRFCNLTLQRLHSVINRAVD